MTGVIYLASHPLTINKERVQRLAACNTRVARGINTLSQSRNDFVGRLLDEGGVWRTVRLGEIGTAQIGTILIRASVVPRKTGTDLLGSWWP